MFSVVLGSPHADACEECCDFHRLQANYVPPVVVAVPLIFSLLKSVLHGLYSCGNVPLWCSADELNSYYLLLLLFVVVIIVNNNPNCDKWIREPKIQVPLLS